MEKKHIKDYLPLYIDCEVEASNGLTYKNNFSFMERLDSDKYSFGWDGIKLVLRQLSDMTEEDCPEWFKEWMPDGFSVFHQVDNAYKYVQIDSETTDGYCLTIHPDGSMSCECKDNGDQYAYKGGDLFRHLLSKHFDLFGLIESGLAISSTTK